MFFVRGWVLSLKSLSVPRRAQSRPSAPVAVMVVARMVQSKHRNPKTSRKLGEIANGAGLKTGGYVST